jgi:hypothetical protein
MAAVLASEAFQLALDPRRHLVLDPSLTATMGERFKALAIRTSNVLLEKLDNPEVSDLILLKATEVSVKALGMGAQAAPQLPAPQQTSIGDLADKLMDMARLRRSGEVVDVVARDVD